jgi:hypothetical protein
MFANRRSRRAPRGRVGVWIRITSVALFTRDARDPDPDAHSSAGLRPARERLVSVALVLGDRYPRSSAKIRVSC